jgi:hypothetical protein
MSYFILFESIVLEPYQLLDGINISLQTELIEAVSLTLIEHLELDSFLELLTPPPKLRYNLGALPVHVLEVLDRVLQLVDLVGQRQILNLQPDHFARSMDTLCFPGFGL